MFFIHLNILCDLLLIFIPNMCPLLGSTLLIKLKKNHQNSWKKTQNSRKKLIFSAFLKSCDVKKIAKGKAWSMHARTPSKTAETNLDCKVRAEYSFSDQT